MMRQVRLCHRLFVTLALGRAAAGRSNRPERGRDGRRPRFQSTTQLVVETVVGERQERQTRRRSDREGFHRHRRRRRRRPSTFSNSRSCQSAADAPPASPTDATSRRSRSYPHSADRAGVARRTRVSRPPPAGAVFRHDRDAGAGSVARASTPPRNSSERR